MSTGYNADRLIDHSGIFYAIPIYLYLWVSLRCYKVYIFYFKATEFIRFHLHGIIFITDESLLTCKTRENKARIISAISLK